MSKRGKILHRQTFQNSNNIVELTVKTIPKDKVPESKSSTTQVPFVRDCALRKELEKAGDDKNNNVNINKNALKKLAAPKANPKSSGGRVTVEVLQKSNKKHHKFVPQDKTWDDVLRSCSTINSFDESDNIQHLSHARREENITKKRRNPTRGSTQSPETEQSSTPDLIVNQRIQSEETSSQECRPIGMNANVEEHSSSSHVRNDRNKVRRLRIRSPNHIENSQLNNNGARGTMASSHQDQQPELAKQTKGSGTNRLFSDDVNASPFGESALQLLHQLRERLQARGDCEGMDMVGAFEKYITGQGSTGDVGISNIPNATSSVSPVCSTVFPTPSRGPLPSHCQQHSQPVRPTQSREMQNQYAFHSAAQLMQPVNYPTEHFHQVPTSHSYTQQQYLSNHQERPPMFNQNSRQEQGLVNQSKNEDLRREIEKQEKIIKEQQNDLLQLRALSTHLIAQQEQLNLQAREAARNSENHSRIGLQENPQTVSRVTQTSEFQTEKVILVEPTQDRDSSTPVSSASQMDRQYRSKLIQLQTENETLRREVRGHRDLILNLENQLTKVYQDLESERHSRSGLSSSRFSGSAPNLDHFGRLCKETVPEKLIQSKPPSQHGESEADSAYEEKTSSQVTSKVGSPHVDKQEGQDGSGQSKASRLPSNDNDTRYFKVVDSHHHLSHPTQNSRASSQESNVPSITRNVTSTSQQPISQNAILSVALSDSSSYSSSEAYKVSHQSLNSQKSSNPEISVRKLQDKPAQATAQIKYMNSNAGILLSDIDPEPGKGLDSLLFPSFSSVSEESQQDKSVYQESSFLHGIPHSGNTLGSDTTGNFQIERDILDSVNVLSGPTMESTRVKEKSPPYVSKGNTSDLSFLPISMQKTSTSALNVVDELH